MHKINTAILTRFLFILDSTKAVQTGKTVTYEIRKPDDTVFASGNMAEIGTTGFYKQSWTPNVVGWWIFKISCASPVANDVRAYFVESGLEKDIKDLLEHATYGLSALETLVDGVEAELTVIKGAGFVQATDALSKIRDAIDALNNLSQADILSDATPFAGADIATIKGYVDEIESLLKNGTYGLSALNTKLVAIQADLDNPNQYKADVTGLALEATLTAMKGGGWTVETLKAIYDAMALESTLTAIKGGGWTNETLKAIKDAIDALNNLSAASVWSYGTRTLTDPNSYKADVSALALEATLGTHDTDIKALLGTVQTDLDNPNQYKANVASLALEASLGTHDTDVKALINALNNISTAQVNSEVDTALADINLDHLIQTASTVNDAGATATDFDTALAEASNDHYNGLLIVFTSGALAGQARRIKDYDGTSKNIIVHTAFTEAPANSDAFVIVTGNYSDLIERTKGLDDIHDDLGTHATALATHDTEVKAEIDANETKIDTAQSDITAIKGKTDNLPASPAPASEYDTEMARITADVATEAKQDTIDTNVDDIETDTSDIQPRIPRITCHMDFWSDSQAVANITAGGEAGVVSLPDVVVAGLPTGVTIIRVVALLKIAIIKDTSAGDNAVDVATGHVEVQKGGGGGYATAIDIPDNAWSIDVSEATERGGDVMIGDNDLGPSGANKVDGNATYNFQFDDIGADGTNLQLVDVMVGLRVYFTV